jgi:hypothetical protein
MEFLLTYIWAILVIIVAIGMLSYFGVFKFKGFVSKQCTGKPDLPCTNFPAFSNGFTTDDFEVSHVSFEVRNIMPGSIKLIDIKTKDFDDCNIIASGIKDKSGNFYRSCEKPTIKQNELFLVQVYCSEELSDVVRGELILEYEYGPTTLVHENFFSLKSLSYEDNASTLSNRIYEDRNELCCEIGLFGIGCYKDNDNDTYGGGNRVVFCTPDGLCPDTYVERSGDCYDYNDEVSPDQTKFFTSPYLNGDFDYNCDNNESKDENCETCSTCKAIGSCDGSCGSGYDEKLEYNCNTDIECGEEADQCKVIYIYKGGDSQGNCWEQKIPDYVDSGKGKESFCNDFGEIGRAGITSVGKKSFFDCGCN